MILIVCYTVLVIAQLAKVACDTDRSRLKNKWIIACTVASAYAGLLGVHLYGK